jgi:hypothetical protein
MMVMMMMMLLLMLIDCMYGVQVASAPFFALRTVLCMPCPGTPVLTPLHTRVFRAHCLRSRPLTY